jgi:hypothetical protein
LYLLYCVGSIVPVFCTEGFPIMSGHTITCWQFKQYIPTTFLYWTQKWGSV